MFDTILSDIPVTIYSLTTVTIITTGNFSATTYAGIYCPYRNTETNSIIAIQY